MTPPAPEAVPPLDKQCLAEVCITAGAESALTVPPLDKQCLAEVCIKADFNERLRGAKPKVFVTLQKHTIIAKSW